MAVFINIFIQKSKICFMPVICIVFVKVFCDFVWNQIMQCRFYQSDEKLENGIVGQKQGREGGTLKSFEKRIKYIFII